MKSASTLNYLIFTTLLLVSRILSAQQIAPSCGTDDSLTVAYLQKISQRIDLTQARINAGEMLEYRIAVDVEYATATKYGHDEGKIREAVYKMFADASAIFEREMNIRLAVTYIHIWQEPEPYKFENDLDYFTKVKEYWDENRNEERDAVVGVSIRSGWFYGGYRMATSTLPSPNTTSDPGLLAHELGHTLGSPHTHNCYWPGGPIDHCEELEGPNETCPSGSKEYLNGSIMSYCRAKLTFHPLCRNLIREFAEGKINPSFSLKPSSQLPAAPGPLKVLTKSGDANDFAPYFEWFASERASKFRFQIATDKAFTQIVEDTVVNQAFYHSPGQSDGNYFARFQGENSHGGSGWSAPAAFNISGWKNSSSPPQLIGVTRTSGGVISGSFRNLEGISSYQMQVQLPFSTEMHEAVRQSDNLKTQHFSVQLPIKRDQYYAMKFRVNKQGTWTDWSQWIELQTADFTTNILPDSTLPLSTQPVLALQQWVPVINTDAFTGQLQIATDPSFKNIVFQQPFSNNDVGDWLSDKTVFVPSLEENTSYYARSRMQLSGLPPSGWQTSRFTTGSHDNRFKFLGVPSEALQTTSYANTEVLYNRFLKADKHLYVFNFNGGYHHTTDLQTWKTYMPSTTKGQSPMNLGAFGAASDGQTLAIDFTKNVVVQQSNDTFVKSTPNLAIYLGHLQAMVHTKKDGYFFKNAEEGVVQIKDMVWLYHRNALYLNRPVCLAGDNQERVWVMGEGGFTAFYENGRWADQPQFPFWESVSGMAFDARDNCYVYGSFGVFVLNAGAGSWDAIEALRPFSVKKVIFDSGGNMWLASYRRDKWENPKLDNYALIRYSGGKASVYSDGLNFLREPFDIEYFQDKLLIMTTGGEIHAFDEKQILSFTPQETYCAGQQLSLGLATNSSFTPENKTSIELRQSGTGKIITWEVANPESRRISTSLPDTLPQGRYSLSIHTTAPEITSYQSAEFNVLPTSSCNEAKGIQLLQNRPNPIGVSGTISFYLPQAVTVKLELFNLHGQKISDLKSGDLPEGWHYVDVNGTPLAAGIYIYRLKAGKITRSLKMIRN
ncbi:M12 family metallo-peptidase [Dyadobacter sp. CY261]|uniref:zinc-dependent metalloprotease n=1 Tax=Dyadobacter sp. CY261 TaxID=2907203 RepID=UPI001F2FC934|nr:zinc-dependent metalloprotease [Dyadobacter sp. CY261]MCF0073821.1 M12 family metallo-peptidase [Dyadobacter sp. CY261]